MNKPLISLEGIGKCYPTNISNGSRIHTVFSLLAGKKNTAGYRALEDVSLDLYAGESLGLIGMNGAGKSTLLKIIAGVVKSSEGTIAVNGRIGALLELGSGFHPEYTGIENIRLSAALMGLSHDEIRHKTNDIIAFADIGEHINQPIKHYSSGMVVRLGFAIATAMRPDILITDEVLAVGDESFQKKCIRWMESYLRDGGTLLLCSHAMYHIQKLCRKAVWIHEGRVQAYGESGDVTRDYLAWHERKEQSSNAPVKTLEGAYATQHLWFENSDGENVESIQSMENISICGLLSSADGRAPVVAIGIVRLDGTSIYGTTSEIDGFCMSQVNAGLFGFCVQFKALPLLPGHYVIRGHAMDPEALRVFDTMERTLKIHGKDRDLGCMKLEHTWHSHHHSKNLPEQL
ncbi:MAG: ABC transporter ATP-binding protein [Mariprofundaceae bacterium]